MGRNKPLAVTDQKVTGNGVDAIGQPTWVLDFLHPEGHKDSGALGSQSTQGFDAPETIGQDGVQPVLLLVAQNGKLAEVFPAYGQQRFRISIQLFQRVRDMHQCNHGKNHTLVALGEVGKKLLCLRPQLLQLVRDRRCKIIFVVLPLLPTGNVTLYA